MQGLEYTLNTVGSNTSGSLQILVACEDAGTAFRACNALQQLFDTLPAQAQFDLNLRQIASLQTHTSERPPHDPALDSDAVILSVHRPDGLPSRLLDWLRSWIEGKGKRNAALAVLFDAAHAESGAARNALEQLRDVTRSAVKLLPPLRATRSARLRRAVKPQARRRAEGRWHRRSSYGMWVYEDASPPRNWLPRRISWSGRPRRFRD